jgi:hypothetical protein
VSASFRLAVVFVLVFVLTFVFVFAIWPRPRA